MGCIDGQTDDADELMDKTRRPTRTAACHLQSHITFMAIRRSADLLVSGRERCLISGHFVDDLCDANHLTLVVQYWHGEYVLCTITGLLVNVFVKPRILYADAYYSLANRQ